MRRGGHDDAQDYYDDDDDDSKARRGVFRSVDCIRIPKYWVNFVASVMHQKPAALLVVVLMAFSLVYLVLHCILPHHTHSRYERFSLHGPWVCCGVFLACVVWLVQDNSKPFVVVDYTVRLRRGKDDDDDGAFRSRAADDADLDKMGKFC